MCRTMVERYARSTSKIMRILDLLMHVAPLPLKSEEPQSLPSLVLFTLTQIGRLRTHKGC